MVGNVENLILEHLRSLKGGQDRIEQELREVQTRLSSLEAAVVGTRRDSVQTREDLARQ